MSNYYRWRQTGGTYFFTVVTHHRREFLTKSIFRNILREYITRTRQNHPFVIDAWVLLPEHLHCIWTMPEGDSDYSTRWSLIKAGFSKKAKTHLYQQQLITDSRKKRRESTIWQRRFWEHLIKDEDDFRKHVEYIHYNPVKHRLVKNVRDWPYSTFHRYVQEGIYSENWGDHEISFNENIGYE